MTIKNMSLAIDLEFQDRLKKVAKQRNVSTSKLIRDIVDKHLGPESDPPPAATIILRIPKDVKADTEELKKWLQIRFDGIVKALS